MMDEQKDARTDGQTDGRTWATLNALPHSTNSGGIKRKIITSVLGATVLPAKSDSDFMFCLQSYQGLKINRSLVY